MVDDAKRLAEIEAADLSHCYEHPECYHTWTAKEELLLKCRRLLTDCDNLRTELIERCELLERMAGPGPCFLAVCFRDHPGAGAIHFANDHDLIYGPAPKAQTMRNHRRDRPMTEATEERIASALEAIANSSERTARMAEGNQSLVDITIRMQEFAIRQIESAHADLDATDDDVKFIAEMRTKLDALRAETDAKMAVLEAAEKVTP